MNNRDFWMGLCVGFWIGAILGTVVMARAEELPRQSWALVDRNYNQVLTIENYTECLEGKVKCLIYLDPTFGLIVTKPGAIAPDSGLWNHEQADPTCDPHCSVVGPDVGVLHLNDNAVMYTARDQDGGRHVILTDKEGRVIVSPQSQGGVSSVETFELNRPTLEGQACDYGKCIPVSCLAKMEAAMLAMESWIPMFTYEGDGNWYDHQRVNESGMKKARAATEQFYDAKRACWRQP